MTQGNMQYIHREVIREEKGLLGTIKDKKTGTKVTS